MVQDAETCGQIQNELYSSAAGTETNLHGEIKGIDSVDAPDEKLSIERGQLMKNTPTLALLSNEDDANADTATAAAETPLTKTHFCDTACVTELNSAIDTEQMYMDICISTPEKTQTVNHSCFETPVKNSLNLNSLCPFATPL